MARTLTWGLSMGLARDARVYGDDLPRLHSVREEAHLVLVVRPERARVGVAEALPDDPVEAGDGREGRHQPAVAERALHDVIRLNLVKEHGPLSDDRLRTHPRRGSIHAEGGGVWREGRVFEADDRRWGGCCLRSCLRVWLAGLAGRRLEEWVRLGMIEGGPMQRVVPMAALAMSAHWLASRSREALVWMREFGAMLVREVVASGTVFAGQLERGHWRRWCGR